MQPNHFQLKACSTLAILALLSTFTHAEDSQFLFDRNGNLLIQAAEINTPPLITGQPQNETVAPGGTASFLVVATGTKPLSYHWRFNHAPIAATTEALLLLNVGANSEGLYSVEVSNSFGSVTSNPAFLVIDSDGDGLGDSWELTHFGNLNQTASANFDGDDFSNLREFLDGTDPADPSSFSVRLLVISDAGSVIKTPNRPTYTNGETVTLTALPPTNGVFHAWLGDIVTRTNPVMLVMTNDKTVHARFTPIVFTWTNLFSGDWETATNWTPNLAPGSNDTAVIVNNVTVTLNTPADCLDLTLGNIITGPTLTGSGTLTVRGAFVWARGTLSGSGRIVIEAGATLDIANPIASAVFLTTRTLENAGTVLWSGAGNIGMSGSVITNRPGSLFHAQSAGSIASVAGSPRFDNAGTFRKSATAGMLIVENGVTFNSSGAVEIQAGTLRLAGGSATGTFDAPATTSVEWRGGAFTLNAGAQLNGAGLYRINISTVTADADLTVENLDLIAGTLNGTGAVTISNAMSWTGGFMSGNGRTIIRPGATLNFSSDASGVGLSGRTLENGGTLLWTGVQSIGLDSGAVITNRAAALFEIKSAASFGSLFTGNRIDNAGTFRKSVNAGTTTVPFSFNNSGTVEIQTGALNLIGGGTNSGSFSVPAGTALNLSGTHAAGGSSSITGGGQLTISGGTANLAGLVNLGGSNIFSGGAATLTGQYICTNNTMIISGGTANFDGTGIVAPSVVSFSSGTLGGSNPVTVGSLMNWTAGLMSGSGRTIIAAGATLNLSGASGVTLGRTLENGGTVLWTGSGGLGMGVITNRPSALFDVRNPANFSFFAAGARFDNAGTFRKSANSGTTTVGSPISFNNSGTVDFRNGILAANGGYISTSNALLNCALGGTTPGTGHGQLQVGGAGILNGGLSVDLLPGFSPGTNDTFTVVTANPRNGAFASFSYPANRITMQLSNAPNAVVLRVTDVFPIPLPFLLTPELASPDLRLIWTATSNVTYRLEFNSEIGATNWTAIPGDVTTLSNQAAKLDALTSSNHFYRVRVIP